MKPCAFNYHRPETLQDAMALLAALAPDGGRVLAGGQSLVPMMAFRMAQPGHLIDINQIAELAGLVERDNTLRIGATTRHAALSTPVCAGPLREMLRFVAGHIAHAPIRNRGTFGGSLANADPASEWCLVLATLGGEVEAARVSGTRRIAGEAFLTGVMATDLREDEIITAVTLPTLQGWCWGFYEINRRAGDYAMAMCLAAYKLQDGVMNDVRLGVGGAEARPRRLRGAEDVLRGAAPDAKIFAGAAQVAAAEIDPMTDHKMSAAFRRDLVRAAVKRALMRSLA